MLTVIKKSSTAAAPSSGYFGWKAVLDRVLGLLLLVPALPLIAVLAAGVRLTSKGPAIYRQRRVGKGGREFVLYKLRSMRSDAEAETGPVWANGGSDQRVTRFGAWLRRHHLDELPQLFNVVRGEMSLVGPRPERPEFVTVLARQIPGYLDRLQVMGGITGLAQVNLPSDTDQESVRRKLALDCEYVRTAGILLDVRILACTLLQAVGMCDATAARWMRLARNVTLPAPVSAVNDLDRTVWATPQAILVSAAANEPSSSEHRVTLACRLETSGVVIESLDSATPIKS